VATRSKTFGRALAGILGSNPAGGHGCLFLVNVVCFQVEVSATGRSLVQRSPIESGVSECDLETSKMRRPRTYLGCCATGKERKIPPYRIQNQAMDAYGGNGSIAPPDLTLGTR
jgi:hypothetical protein